MLYLIRHVLCPHALLIIKLSIIYCSHQKTTQLKSMLESPDLEFIMEAHNGLSAKIVQEAGAVSVSDCFYICKCFS